MSLAVYAKSIGVPKQTVSDWINAAEVYEAIAQTDEDESSARADSSEPDENKESENEFSGNSGDSGTDPESGILSAPPSAKSRVPVFELTPTHYREIHKAEESKWEELARRAVAEKWSVKKAEEEARKYPKKKLVKERKMKEAITLADWNKLKVDDRKRLLSTVNLSARFIEQSGDSIDWSHWSTNPVTGCLHNCAYCYARDIADRFYVQKFEPSIVPGQLSSIDVHPVPAKEKDPSWRNVFLCSMADLFGKWVPEEWIGEVLRRVRNRKEFNFLVLTKFPKRYLEFEIPNNMWVGTTVDCQAKVKTAEKVMREVKAKVKFVSLEPLLEPVKMSFQGLQWVIVGGSSQSTQTPEWMPPWNWVADITNRAMKEGCAVFHKSNLGRLREWPGHMERKKGLPREFKIIG
jgi:protein gp37